MSELTQNPFASTHSLDQNPFDDPAPAFNGNPTAATDRAAELDRRERELARREQELAQRAEHIRTHGKNNWPPFLPLIYHDISEEIPEESRSFMTRMYQLWLVLLATLILNFVACLLILLAGRAEGGKDLGGSIGYIFLIAPLSFLLWYRPIYNGYMKEQSLYYYLYFFFCGFHLIFSIYMIIGIPSTGSAGLIQTIQMFVRPAIPAAILGLIATVGWTVQAVGLGWLYRSVWRHHAEKGHTMEKARSEVQSAGLKAYFVRG